MKQKLVSAIFPAVVFAAAVTFAGDARPAEERSDPSLTASAFLIRDPAVQAELQLSPEQLAAVGRLMDEADSVLWPLRDPSPEDGETKFRTLIMRVEDALKPILALNQQTRLNQIVLQAQGYAVLTRPDVARAFGLTGDQQDRIREAVDTTRQAFRKIDEMARKGENREQLARVAQRFRAEEGEKVRAALTPRQKARWTAMAGSPFDLSRVIPFAFKAPELRPAGAWINSEPLTLAKLRGKVVAIHFWTFGCGNCIANYPAYKAWHEAYATKGLTIIGIHTPETQGERDAEKVRQKARDNGLAFPILIDNDRRNWDAWSNRVWPAVYLVDKKGRVRWWWYGELNWAGAKGDQFMREKIEELLAEKEPSSP